MKNKVWLVGLFMLGILVGLGATSAFAQEPTQTADVSGNLTWQQMRQACINGDFETMQQLRNQVCGGYGATDGTVGPGCGAGGWQNNGTNQQPSAGNSGTRNGWRGMMGGGRGMMGSWTW